MELCGMYYLRKGPVNGGANGAMHHLALFEVEELQSTRENWAIHDKSGELHEEH